MRNKNWLKTLTIGVGALAFVACGGNDPYWTPGPGAGGSEPISGELPGPGGSLVSYVPELSTLTCHVVEEAGLPSLLEVGAEPPIAGSDQGNRMCFEKGNFASNFCAAANYWDTRYRQLQACMDAARNVFNTKGLEIFGNAWPDTKHGPLVPDIWAQRKVEGTLGDFQKSVISFSTTPDVQSLPSQTFCASKNFGQPVLEAFQDFQQNMLQVHTRTKADADLLQQALSRGVRVKANGAQSGQPDLVVNIDIVTVPVAPTPGECTFSQLP